MIGNMSRGNKMKKNDLRSPNVRLSPQDQIELGRRMVLSNDTKARETLVLNCIPLVKSLARSRLCSVYADYDDIFQDGMLGVLDAISKYDYKENVAFTSFAYTFIQGKMNAGLLRQLPVKLTKTEFFRVALIHSTIESYTKELNKSPSDEELAQLTSLPLKDIKNLRRFSVNAATEPYDENTVGSGQTLFSGGDIAVLFERAASNKKNAEAIYHAMSTLNDNEKEIIQKRYLYDEVKTPLKELAESQGVSLQSILNRERRALNRLFNYFVVHNLFFEDFLC